MFFDKLLEEKKLSEFLEKIEKCIENCQTEEGAECLDDLEYSVADHLDSVQEIFDYHKEIDGEIIRNQRGKESRLDFWQKCLRRHDSLFG